MCLHLCAYNAFAQVVSLCVHPHPRTITRSKGSWTYGGKSVKRRTRTDPYGEDRVGDGIGGGDGGGGGGG